MKTPIESLLNIKRWHEDEAKNFFAVLLKELAVEEKQLLNFEHQYNTTSKKLECSSDELVNISEFMKLNEYLEQLLVKIHHQMKVIAEKERLVELARRALIEATKEKKVFEKLDEKHKDLIKAEFRRKEQIGTDEHAVTGHNRKKA
ncbi:MAG TPA: flagellar export protein FliJ [Deltaproteobacteria bacterium]|nr:flagellar export protein FliJ [Deltaproteobacteria bacterium]